MNGAPFPTLRHEVDRLFDFLVHNAWGPPARPKAWMPAADICESAELYRIEIDLPGVRHEDLSIATHARSVEVKGTRARRHEIQTHTCLAERPSGAFSRSFQLPQDADARGVRARLEEGVLTLEIPRKGSEDRRRG